jgi:DNA-binding MarR family transcriptional regulator
MSSIMRKSVDNVNHVGSAPAAAAKRSPAEAVIELVHDVMHQFRGRQYQVLRDGAHDVTHMESKVMGFYSRHPGATLSELVAHSGRDKAQLARLVKGLRERELLLAEPDPVDRRNVHLTLSEAGRAVQRALHAQAHLLNTRAVDGLDAAEQAQLIALLGRLKANLDAVGGE